MKNKREIKTVLLTMVVVSLLWGVPFSTVYYQKHNQQNYIDLKFSSSFRSLVEDLFGIDYQSVDNETFQNHCVSMQSSAQFCISMLSISSYSESESLEDIILVLSDWAQEPLSYNKVDRELYEDLGYLVLHLEYQDWPELADEVWDKLNSVN